MNVDATLDTNLRKAGQCIRENDDGTWSVVPVPWRIEPERDRYVVYDSVGKWAAAFATHADATEYIAGKGRA